MVSRVAGDNNDDQSDDKTDTDSSSSQNNVIFSNTSQNLATGSDKDLGDKPATTDISSDDNGEDTDWDLLLNDINAIVEDCDSEDLDLPVPCSCHNLPLGNCPSNISNTINLIKQVTSSGVPNRDNVQHQVGPLNIPAWEERLQEYWDKEDVLAGNTYGWELGRWSKFLCPHTRIGGFTRDD